MCLGFKMRHVLTLLPFCLQGGYWENPEDAQEAQEEVLEQYRQLGGWRDEEEEQEHEPGIDGDEEAGLPPLFNPLGGFVDAIRNDPLAFGGLPLPPAVPAVPAGEEGEEESEEESEEEGGEWRGQIVFHWNHHNRP